MINNQKIKLKLINLINPVIVNKKIRNNFV